MFKLAKSFGLGKITSLYEEICLKFAAMNVLLVEIDDLVGSINNCYKA